MKQKEIMFLSFCDQWKPLVTKSLSQNNILGLEKEDLEQEIIIVLWECFTNCNVTFLPTYLSSAIHKRISDLYTESLRFYYLSTNLQCTACNTVVFSKPTKCPNCGANKWTNAKGERIISTYLDIPFEIDFDSLEEREYPPTIRRIIDSIENNRKTGYIQKNKLKEFIRNGN